MFADNWGSDTSVLNPFLLEHVRQDILTWLATFDRKLGKTLSEAVLDEPMVQFVFADLEAILTKTWDEPQNIILNMHSSVKAEHSFGRCDLWKSPTSASVYIRTVARVEKFKGHFMHIFTNCPILKIICKAKDVLSVTDRHEADSDTLPSFNFEKGS